MSPVNIVFMGLFLLCDKKATVIWQRCPVRSLSLTLIFIRLNVFFHIKYTCTSCTCVLYLPYKDLKRKTGQLKSSVFL